MTEEIINTDNNIKLREYCKACVCQACKQHNDDTEEIAKLSLDVFILEKERDELQDKYSKLIHKYNDLYEKYRAQEILIPDLQEEIKRFDALSIKYSQALEKIRNIITNDNSIIIDKEVYFELQCGEPVALKLQKIFNLINEVYK